ncbi:MAG: NAD(P)-dependent alcohol dehydrogenase [Proteobacteria bacterium]|nr:NAD(P)-dependent alcohol dehydrogenase [Pseudomonadota bacterium]
MKAWEIRDWNIENLVLGERPEPVLGPRDVLLRIKAASLNYRDPLVVDRGYGRYTGELPLIPVGDAVGEVIEIGAKVTRIAVGDRVCPCFNQSWLDGPYTTEHWWNQLGGRLDGVMRERMAVDERFVVKVPDHLTDLEAATLPCAGVTAWSALVEAGGIEAGDTVLIQGSGGVSLYALLIAKAFGCRVIATTSSADKARRLEALGADSVIDYTADPDWGKTAWDLTEGRGADVVVEVGGANTLKQSLRAVTGGGTVALIGNLSGNAVELNLPSVFLKAAKMVGIVVGHRASFEALARCFAVNRLRPVVDDKVFAFGELHEALARQRDGGFFGKIVIRFDEAG